MATEKLSPPSRDRNPHSEPPRGRRYDFVVRDARAEVHNGTAKIKWTSEIATGDHAGYQVRYESVPLDGQWSKISRDLAWACGFDEFDFGRPIDAVAADFEGRCFSAKLTDSKRDPKYPATAWWDRSDLKPEPRDAQASAQDADDDLPF